MLYIPDRHRHKENKLTVSTYAIPLLHAVLIQGQDSPLLLVLKYYCLHTTTTSILLLLAIITTTAAATTTTTTTSY